MGSCLSKEPEHPVIQENNNLTVETYFRDIYLPSSGLQKTIIRTASNTILRTPLDINFAHMYIPLPKLQLYLESKRPEVYKLLHREVIEWFRKTRYTVKQFSVSQISNRGLGRYEIRILIGW